MNRLFSAVAWALLAGSFCLSCQPSELQKPDGHAPAKPTGAWGQPESLSPKVQGTRSSTFTEKLKDRRAIPKDPLPDLPPNAFATPHATVSPLDSILATLPATPGWSPSMEFQFVDPLDTTYGPPRPPIHSLDKTIQKELLDWKECPNVVDWDPALRVATNHDASLDPMAVVNHVIYIAGRLVDKDETGFLDTYLLPGNEFHDFMDGLGQPHDPDAYARLKERLVAQFAELKEEHAEFVSCLDTRADRLIGLRRFARVPYVYKTSSGAEKTGCIQLMLARNTWFAMDLRCHTRFEDLDHYTGKNSEGQK